MRIHLTVMFDCAELDVLDQAREAANTIDGPTMPVQPTQFDGDALMAPMSVDGDIPPLGSYLAAAQAVLTDRHGPDLDLWDPASRQQLDAIREGLAVVDLALQALDTAA